MQVGAENFLRRSNESEFMERIEEKMHKLSQGEGVLHQVLCFGIKKKKKEFIVILNAALFYLRNNS